MARYAIVDAIEDRVYGNVTHHVPCDRLPAAPQVDVVLSAHQDVVEKIKTVNPGLVDVYPDLMHCIGKADIVISFGSRQDRFAIEKIIDGETFFGVPYRLINV